ncbi:MAG TPA: DUF86 domain-containing protein [Deltaproteobacteria bacterium]|nr:DUF86 domain-containing protein [Deltaproteobacteria bacterium]HIJ76333.1 DUF86 domain-containing protein [Deltaproteobacteria bacterium]
MPSSCCANFFTRSFRLKPVSGMTRLCEARKNRLWNLIVSMRNRLIHGYFDIDRDIVWKTATTEFQALLPRLQVLITRG